MSEATTVNEKTPLVGATFVTSAAQWSQLPEAGPMEIAFAGRSNAGKSSAINVLAQRTRLAFASRTPGRTQQINFFVLRNGAYIVDLPGYGYAAVARQTKNEWQDFLWRYVTERRTLSALVLLSDIRRGLTDLDYPVLDLFLSSGRPVLVLVTKADKLARQAQRSALTAMQNALRQRYQERAQLAHALLFSALKKTGVEQANQIINDWMSL
jgi:ribosome biogenesis GTP-binding protein YsxC/EngB